MIRLINILVVALSLVACQAQNNAIQIDTDGVQAMADEDSVFIIDVRTPGEVASGFIAGTDYFFNVNGGNFNESIAELDTNNTYIVYCRSGVRSTNAINIMSKSGFSNLYELSGGILGWKDANSIVTE